MSDVPHPNIRSPSTREGTLAAMGTVSRWPGQHQPLRPSQLGAGDDDVAVALDSQGGTGPQGALDQVGQARLVTRHRLDVDEGGGERGGVGAEIEHELSLGPSLAPPLTTV